jgi:predicted RNA-binding protein with PIN domain
VVLVVVVGFGLAWAEPGRGRDVSERPFYLLEIVDEPANTPSIWLVDGFNVLHAGILRGRDRSEWWTEPRRRALLDRVHHFDDPCAELWVVFDGPRAPVDPAAEAGPGPREVFADSADDWLLARVRASDDPSRIAVVTADRAVASRARHRGAQVVSPRAFLERCNG